MTWEGALAVIALVLSAASFYHEFFARGRVVLANPVGLALREGRDNTGHWRQLWRFRLVFCNTGARPRVIHNMRLLVVHQQRTAKIPVGQWKETVKPKEDESRLADTGGDFAGGVALPPRSTFERIGVFIDSGDEPWLQFPGVYECTVEALLDGLRRESLAWQALASFRISLREKQCALLGSGDWIYRPTLDNLQD